MADEADDKDKSKNIPDDGADDDQDQDDSGAKSEDVESLKEQNKKLFERAKKAEGFVKDSDGHWVKKPKVEPKPETKSEDKNKSNAQVSDPVEVAKLANALSGLSDSEINELTAVAKMRGVSLAEAKKDPLFSAWQAKYLEDAKRERSKRGASQGSSQGEEDKAVEGLIPDIHKTPEEQRQAHRAAVQKMMGK